MQKTIIIILFLPLVSFAQEQDTTKIRYVNSFREIEKNDVFYNVFQYKGNILLLKDKRPFNSYEIDSRAYLSVWKAQNKLPKESENFFLLDAQLNKPEASDARLALGTNSLFFPLEQYKGIQSEAFRIETKKTGLQDKILVLMATVYECTNKHTGSPHSGTDKEKLKKDFGCKEFRAKLL